MTWLFLKSLFSLCALGVCHSLSSLDICVEIPLVYLLCLFYSCRKVENMFDSIKLKVGGKRANGNGPRCIVLLYWYYQGLVPSENSQVDEDSLPSFSVSSVSAHALNHLNHTITRLRKPVCKAGRRSAPGHTWAELTRGPGSWSCHLPTGYLRRWFSSLPYRSGPSRWHIKRITGIKLQPCLGSGTKWKGCAFEWPVQHNEFPREL